MFEEKPSNVTKMKVRAQSCFAEVVKHTHKTNGRIKQNNDKDVELSNAEA